MKTPGGFWGLVHLWATLVASAPTTGSPAADDSHMVRRAAPFTCPVFNDYSGKTVFFYVVHSDPKLKTMATAKTLDTRIQTVRKAIVDALAAYSAWGGSFKIYIGLVGTIPDPEKPGRGPHGVAEAGTTVSGKFDRCNVLIAASPDEKADATLRMKKAIAHELYHCIQYVENLAGMSKGTVVQRAWWVEGTARFMDGEAYPITPARKAVTDMGIFPEDYNPSSSLVEQSYAAALFFHYTRNIGKPLNAINSWVTAKDGKNSPKDDLADIAKANDYLPFSGIWHGFAFAFATKMIKYPSGDIINHVTLTSSALATESLTKDATRKAPRTVKAFTFNIIRFTLPANTQYKFGVPVASTTFLCSVRRKGETEWGLLAFDAGIYSSQVASGTTYMETLCSCASANDCSGSLTVKRTT